MLKSIKKLFVLIAFLSFNSLLINAQDATSWKIDKPHTSVNFSINHFFSAVTGKFNEFDGTINFDRENLKGSKVDFTIAVASVNTDDAKRDKHLQSGDFFDEEKYPNMTFKSTRFEKKSETEYVVYGNMTIRDVTKEIAIPFKITGEMEHPMMKGTMILGIAANLTLNRTDYGVGTGSWAATAVVGDDVDIKINMELNKKK